MRRRRSRWTPIVAAAVVILAGFAVALVEVFHLPKGSIWIVAGAAALLLVLVRLVGRRLE